MSSSTDQSIAEREYSTAGMGTAASAGTDAGSSAGRSTGSGVEHGDNLGDLGGHEHGDRSHRARPGIING